MNAPPPAAAPSERHRRNLRAAARAGRRQIIAAWLAGGGILAVNVLTRELPETQLLRPLDVYRATRNRPALRDAYTALRGMRLEGRARDRENADWREDRRDDMRADVRGEYEQAVL